MSSQQSLPLCLHLAVLKKEPKDDSAELPKAKGQPKKVKAYSFTDDKKEYNKFHFRLSQAPEDVKKQWETLKKKEGDEVDNFVAEIMKMKKGKLPEEFLAKYKVDHDDAGDDGDDDEDD
eukprot:10912998-Karenia_brevis.AAC.1